MPLRAVHFEIFGFARAPFELLAQRCPRLLPISCAILEFRALEFLYDDEGLATHRK